MKKLLVFVSMLLFAAVAVAQTCDLTMGPMVVLYKGAPYFTEKGQLYSNLTPAEAGQIVARSQQVLDESVKGRGHRGDYMITFDGSTTCQGVPISPAGPYDGLTHQDAMKVLRLAYGKVAEGHIQQSEKHVAKGGKGPWGKE